MYCGRDVVTSGNIMSAWLSAPSLRIKIPKPANMALLSIAGTRQALLTGQQLSLLSLLMRHRTAETAGQRDKVLHCVV